MTEWTGRVIWSLANSGGPTTISGAGNSGLWTPASQRAVTPVDFRFIDDLAVLINVGGITGTPAFTVTLNGFDDLGNPFPLITSPSIATAGKTALYLGRHGAASATTAYVVFPDWGQVTWNQTGAAASVTGVEITLYGRG